METVVTIFVMKEWDIHIPDYTILNNLASFTILSYRRSGRAILLYYYIAY